MFRRILAFLKSEHVHCFSDKRHDFLADDGRRVIVMACNKCGLEEYHTIEERGA